jgi:flagellar biosynthesis/type III secretory pathway ATPase
VSRLGAAVSSDGQRDAARRLREALATYHQSEDLIQLGAYVAGSNPKLDAAIRARSQIIDFLRQEAVGKSPLEETVARLSSLAGLLP